MTNVAPKSGSLKEDVAQKPGSLKEDVAQKASSSKEDVAQKPGSLKEDVAQKPGSLKEVVAKNRVAAISAIVVVGLIVAGGAYMLWKRHASSVGTAQEQSSQQSPIERAGKDVKTLIDRLRGRDMPRVSLKPMAESKQQKST